jgi:hypothetical protein
LSRPEPRKQNTENQDRSSSKWATSNLLNIVWPDIIILEISGPDIEKFRNFNIYNERRETENSNNWTVERSLQRIDATNSTNIYNYFNTHHQWWSSCIKNPIRNQNLVNWLHKRNCELLNTPDQSIFERSNTINTSVIDLTFATPNLVSKIAN